MIQGRDNLMFEWVTNSSKQQIVKHRMYTHLRKSCIRLIFWTVVESFHAVMKSEKKDVGKNKKDISNITDITGNISFMLLANTRRIDRDNNKKPLINAIFISWIPLYFWCFNSLNDISLICSVTMCFGLVLKQALMRVSILFPVLPTKITDVQFIIFEVSFFINMSSLSRKGAAITLHNHI